ncbi:glycerophosphodiester phosphodiesterase family protein [Sedimenticola sp.]|uniref:glycerophosphodiester phosphodiesterase family protein n=1 Tax=Sedimenticola sp. TaxID=1940285 RepID=UPI003D1249CB
MNDFFKRLVAHRGYMERFPENSWCGIKAALEKGTRWVEFDIQMYQPGKFILLHDADLQRTANTTLSVFDLTESQLRQVSIHEPDRLGDRYNPEYLISLEDILAKLATFPLARAMVEIKEESLAHWDLESVMQPLLAILNRFKAQCVLISFSLEALNYARDNSDIEIGWVLRSYSDENINQASKLKPEYLICNHNKLPDNKPPAAGTWHWMLYDITDPLLASQWVSRGIDMIETRDIGTLIDLSRSNRM